VQTVDHLVDGGGGLALDDAGQAGIASGGGGAGVTEQALDMAKA